MKILICTFTFPPDTNGVAAVTAAHARHFADAGHDVTVATGIASGGELPFEFDHLHVRRFNVTGNAHFKCPYRGEHREYVEFIKNWRGDIAFFHCWSSWATDLLLSQMRKLPFRTVMVSHGFNAQRYPQNMRFPRGLRHWLCWQPYIWRLPSYLRAISHLVVLSQSTDPRWYYDHTTAKKIGMQNVSVIPSGIHLQEFDLMQSMGRAELGVTTSRMILVVGNYFPEPKNQAYALRAFAVCNPADCTLVFVGSRFNEYSKFLQSEAERMNVGDKVRFHAAIPRNLVCAAYGSADLVLCSSLSESGPIVLLESMAAGTPFISTDVGFARCLKGGVIVDSETSMALEMERLLADASLRRAFGSAGRDQCEREYSWDAVMKKYDSLILEIVG